MGTRSPAAETRLGSRVAAAWWQKLLPLNCKRRELNHAIAEFEQALDDLKRALGKDVR